MKLALAVRDREGNVLATKRMQREFCYDPLLAKSFGALQATVFGRELSLRMIILESDSLQVINSITQQDTSWSCVEMIITNVKNCLLLFWMWDVKHVRREVNNVAHCLTKSALELEMDCIQMEKSPFCILALL